MYLYTAKGTNNFLPANSHFVSILKLSQKKLALLELEHLITSISVQKLSSHKAALMFLHKVAVNGCVTSLYVL